MCVCVCARACTRVCVCMGVCVDTCVHVCDSIRKHLEEEQIMVTSRSLFCLVKKYCACVCMCTCVCMCVRVCVHVCTRQADLANLVTQSLKCTVSCMAYNN